MTRAVMEDTDEHTFQSPKLSRAVCQRCRSLRRAWKPIRFCATCYCYLNYAGREGKWTQARWDWCHLRGRRKLASTHRLPGTLSLPDSRLSLQSQLRCQPAYFEG